MTGAASILDRGEQRIPGRTRRISPSLEPAGISSDDRARDSGADDPVAGARCESAPHRERRHPSRHWHRPRRQQRGQLFLRPEVPGTLPRARDGFKDRHGALAKQAARFRIYGYDANGRVVREITAQEAGITWSVDVANSKAAWYEVNKAFDIAGAPPVPRRNASVMDRSSLIVQANRRVVRGASAASQPLDGGSFQGQKISLGEVFTDERGRLVFLPGKGAAYSTSSRRRLGDLRTTTVGPTTCATGRFARRSSSTAAVSRRSPRGSSRRSQITRRASRAAW